MSDNSAEHSIPKQRPPLQKRHLELAPPLRTDRPNYVRRRIVAGSLALASIGGVTKLVDTAMHTGSTGEKTQNHKFGLNSTVSVQVGSLKIDVPKGGFLNVREEPFTQSSGEDHGAGDVAYTIHDGDSHDGMEILNPVLVQGSQTDWKTGEDGSTWAAFPDPDKGKILYVALSGATDESISYSEKSRSHSGTVTEFDPKKGVLVVEIPGKKPLQVISSVTPPPPREQA